MGTSTSANGKTALDVNVVDGEITLTTGDVNVDVSSLATQTTLALLTVGKTGVVKTASGQIKGASGIVHAVLVSGVGVTVGDKIELKNALTDTGTSLVTIVATAANGTWTFYPCFGVAYSTGVYYTETKSGGTITTTIVYS